VFRFVILATGKLNSNSSKIYSLSDLVELKLNDKKGKIGKEN
jgi:hypothetical protein